MEKKPSLAASTGALANAPKFEMPAIFQEPSGKVVSRFNSAYISFAHPNRKDEFAKLTGKFGQVNEGDMFLIEAEGITKLEVAKLCVLKIKQYWVETDSAGNVLKSSWTEKPWPWKEQMDIAALVLLDDRVAVVNMNPHTTKCSGFKPLSDAYYDCQKPEWADKSPAHKETLQIPQPFMRFFGELTVAPARTSRKSGLPYRTTNCNIKPTSNVEAKLLRAFSESETAGKQMSDAAERFSSRMADLEAKLIK